MWKFLEHFALRIPKTERGGLSANVGLKEYVFIRLRPCRHSKTVRPRAMATEILDISDEGRMVCFYDENFHPHDAYRRSEHMYRLRSFAKIFGGTIHYFATSGFKKGVAVPRAERP